MRRMESAFFLSRHECSTASASRYRYSRRPEKPCRRCTRNGFARAPEGHRILEKVRCISNASGHNPSTSPPDLPGDSDPSRGRRWLPSGCRLLSTRRAPRTSSGYPLNRPAACSPLSLLPRSAPQWPAGFRESESGRHCVEKPDTCRGRSLAGNARP